jgi:hypothetical protein
MTASAGPNCQQCGRSFEPCVNICDAFATSEVDRFTLLSYNTYPRTSCFGHASEGCRFQIPTILQNQFPSEPHDQICSVFCFAHSRQVIHVQSDLGFSGLEFENWALALPRLEQTALETTVRGPLWFCYISGHCPSVAPLDLPRTRDALLLYTHLIPA